MEIRLASSEAADIEEWDSLIASPNAMIRVAEHEETRSGAVVASFDG